MKLKYLKLISFVFSLSAATTWAMDEESALLLSSPTRLTLEKTGGWRDDESHLVSHIGTRTVCSKPFLIPEGAQLTVEDIKTLLSCFATFQPFLTQADARVTDSHPVAQPLEEVSLNGESFAECVKQLKTSLTLFSIGRPLGFHLQRLCSWVKLAPNPAEHALGWTKALHTVTLENIAGLETLEGAKFICSLLKYGYGLKTLTLSHNNLNDLWLRQATLYRVSGTLEELNLSHNKIAGGDYEALGWTAGCSPVLKKLDLSHNKIQDSAHTKDCLAVVFGGHNLRRASLRRDLSSEFFLLLVGNPIAIGNPDYGTQLLQQRFQWTWKMLGSIH